MLSVACAECTKDIPEEAKFCPYCGADNREPEGPPVCLACGVVAAENAKFCSECGAGINVEDIPQPIEKSEDVISTGSPPLSEYIAPEIEPVASKQETSTPIEPGERDDGLAESNDEVQQPDTVDVEQESETPELKNEGLSAITDTPKEDTGKSDAKKAEIDLEPKQGVQAQFDGPNSELDVSSRPFPVQKKKESNYFAEHWRGEHTLGWSFWMNCVVFALVIFIPLSVIENMAMTSLVAVDSSTGGFYKFVHNARIYIITPIFLIWAYVGAWRSATRSKRKILPIILKIYFVINTPVFVLQTYFPVVYLGIVAELFFSDSMKNSIKAPIDKTIEESIETSGIETDDGNNIDVEKSIENNDESIDNESIDSPSNEAAQRRILLQLRNRYFTAIKQKVERNWRIPPGFSGKVDCIVRAIQSSRGEVNNVFIEQCVDDSDALRKSIIEAVKAASPLPTVPDPRLFDSRLKFYFRPDLARTNSAQTTKGENSVENEDSAQSLGEQPNEFYETRLAANQGEVEAQYKLAQAYANGRGVRKNEELAFEWFEKAAAKSHVPSQIAIGWCYENGFGVLRNDIKALEWYRRAALTGDAEAQKALELFRAR